MYIKHFRSFAELEDFSEGAEMFFTIPFLEVFRSLSNFEKVQGIFRISESFLRAPDFTIEVHLPSFPKIQRRARKLKEYTESKTSFSELLKSKTNALQVLLLSWVLSFMFQQTYQANKILTKFATNTGISCTCDCQDSLVRSFDLNV